MVPPRGKLEKTKKHGHREDSSIKSTKLLKLGPAQLITRNEVYMLNKAYTSPRKKKITSAFLLLDQKFLNHIKQTACEEKYFD